MVAPTLKEILRDKKDKAQATVEWLNRDMKPTKPKKPREIKLDNVNSLYAHKERI